MGMRVLAALLVVACISLPCCAQQTTETGTLTIFRERPTNRFKMIAGSTKDQWPVRLHKRITLDGKPLLDMHGERFASFALPAGRHLVEFEGYGGPNASFNLAPGERVFVRPGMAGGGTFLETARYVMTVVPCKEAIQLGRGAQPIEEKYILGGDTVHEDQFASSCAN